MDKPQYTGAYQASAYITLANVPFVKVSHMVKPRVGMEGHESQEIKFIGDHQCTCLPQGEFRQNVCRSGLGLNGVFANCES